MNTEDFKVALKNIFDRSLHGCGDIDCKMKVPSGMATNGGCRCTPFAFSEDLLNLAAETAPEGRKSRWANA